MTSAREDTKKVSHPMQCVFGAALELGATVGLARPHEKESTAPYSPVILTECCVLCDVTGCRYVRLF